MLMVHYGCLLMRNMTYQRTNTATNFRQMMVQRVLIVVMSMVCWWCVVCEVGMAQTQELRIAAASDLQYVLPLICEAFEKIHPAWRVRCIFGASGVLTAQIRAGAPYHVFLSADTVYPYNLVQAGKAHTFRVYARGSLVLWHRRGHSILENLLSALQERDKIAIPNPRHAPFGRYAMQALRYHFSEHQWTNNLEPHIVYADNVMQATHYVRTGNVAFALLPLSVVLAPAMRGYGMYTVIPPHSYQVIKQAGCVVHRADTKTTQVAIEFVEFLRGEDAHAIFTLFGYDVPLVVR